MHAQQAIDILGDIREYYKTHYKLTPEGGDQLYFNPGNSMNSFIVAEPHVAHQVLRAVVDPYIASGQLRMFCGWVPVSVRREGERIRSVAGKCIGTTQITNGAYRLHNIEWAIGEAAGELAAFCLREKVEHPKLDGRELLNYQRELIRQGNRPPSHGTRKEDVLHLVLCHLDSHGWPERLCSADWCPENPSALEAVIPGGLE